jgi:hypothetical protein
MRSYSKHNKSKKGCREAQVVSHLPRKCEDLRANLSTTKQKNLKKLSTPFVTGAKVEKPCPLFGS